MLILLSKNLMVNFIMEGLGWSYLYIFNSFIIINCDISYYVFFLWVVRKYIVLFIKYFFLKKFEFKFNVVIGLIISSLWIGFLAIILLVE